MLTSLASPAPSLRPACTLEDRDVDEEAILTTVWVSSLDKNKVDLVHDHVLILVLVRRDLVHDHHESW